MRSKKSLVAAGLVLVILVGTAGVIWYLSVPHSAEEQFARAEKLETSVRADAKVKTPEQVKPDLDKTIAEFAKVGAWGKADKTVEALKRIEKLQEEVAQSDTDAIKTLDQIIKDFPQEENAGQALLDEARLIRKDADNLKSGKPAEAAPRYKEALAKLAGYLSKFPNGKSADVATMEKGRIWQDGLGDPLINAIETFQKFVKDFPTSDYMDEALYRLGRLYQLAKEYDRAMACYGELKEKYPSSPWADKARIEMDKVLATIMDKKKEAAKDLEDFAKTHPSSPLRGEAETEAKADRSAQASEDHEQYGKTRYGGTVPYDTTADKPMPPAGMLKIYAEQKLHAEKYDLHVTFEPTDHRISVQGTLKLLNRGEDKTQLLLMLSQAMDVKSCTINGLAVRQDLVGQKWTITLASPLKKDAETTLGFEYTGQLAAPMPDMPGHHLKPAATEPTTAPATEPTRALDDKSPEATTVPTTLPGAETAEAALKYLSDPQLALGDNGYGLSGGAWYPITIIGDIFDATIAIKTPSGIEAVTNGALDKRDPDKGDFAFHTEHPVFGLYFAYGKYIVREQTVGAIHYYTYLTERNAGKSEAYVKIASSILNFYSEKFVPFPYEKLAIIEAPLPWFLGGVGPASMMFLHQNMVAMKDPPEFLLAHELAHQWFGNLIPINMTDPGYNQWLSEGFATYCDALYEEKGNGPEAMAHHMQKYGQLYFQMSLTYPHAQQAIKNCFPSSPLYRPVVYEKGALVLHALRKVLGDDKFFLVMRSYVEKYHDKLTTVDDFRHLAADVAGQDLSWFFAEWIDRGDYAHWTFDGVEITPGAKPSDPVKVTVDIRQPDDLIVMPVDITFLGDKKEQRYVMENVMLDKIEQKVDAVVPFKPTKVIIDEDYWVLHTPQADNIWPAQKPEEEKAATEK